MKTKLVMAPGQREELAAEGIALVGVPVATSDEPLIVIALRDDAPGRRVAGATSTRRCIFCGSLVSLAPTSEAVVARTANACVVCMPCAPRLETGGTA
jgi:hypothetical protein